MHTAGNARLISLPAHACTHAHVTNSCFLGKRQGLGPQLIAAGPAVWLSTAEGCFAPAEGERLSDPVSPVERSLHPAL